MRKLLIAATIVSLVLMLGMNHSDTRFYYNYNTARVQTVTDGDTTSQYATLKKWDGTTAVQATLYMKIKNSDATDTLYVTFYSSDGKTATQKAADLARIDAALETTPTLGAPVLPGVSITRDWCGDYIFYTGTGAISSFTVEYGFNE